MQAESPDQQREKRQAALDALVPGIAPSEYGQMPPSFHRNSQRVARPEGEDDQPSHPVQDPPPSVRAPLLTRDKYEGVDSDDESDDEDEDDEDGGSDDERPQLVGDIEIDMSEEQEEFLEFARQALGVSDQQWNDIVNERKDRGGKSLFLVVYVCLLNIACTAFVPKSATGNKSSNSRETSSFPSSDTPARSSRSPAQPKPNLDSFEELMRAMDAELARSRQGRTSTQPRQPPPSADKGKGKATVETIEEEDDSGDIEAAMEAELKDLLEQNADEDEGIEGGMGTDYNLIKNFLESFKSQAGLSGPVGNLAGRLQPDWTLPRDAS